MAAGHRSFPIIPMSQKRNVARWYHHNPLFRKKIPWASTNAPAHALLYRLLPPMADQQPECA